MDSIKSQNWSKILAVPQILWKTSSKAIFKLFGGLQVRIWTQIVAKKLSWPTRELVGFGCLWLYSPGQKPFWTLCSLCSLHSDKNELAVADDEPPHQIRSYTLLFSLFLYFLYIVDPPLHTPTTHDRACAHTPFTLASSDQSRLFDGHMIYDSHVFTSILSISNRRPPTVRPITSPCTTQSGTYYNFTLDEPYARFLVFHLYLTCLYLPFSQIIIREEPHNCPYEFPPELRFSTYALHHLALILHHFALHCTAL